VTIDELKKCAEKDYKKGKINWYEDNHIKSDDLGYVMYHIYKEEVK